MIDCGVSALPFARGSAGREILTWGKCPTEQVIGYDYLDGTDLAGPHAHGGSNKGCGEGYINFGRPFYRIEYILRDAVGLDGDEVYQQRRPTHVADSRLAYLEQPLDRLRRRVRSRHDQDSGARTASFRLLTGR